MTQIKESSLRDLKAHINLADVVSRVVHLQGTGDNLKGLCPFHGERTPSFHVHPVRGFYKCFGCGHHGDVISFIQETESLRFKEAAEALAFRYHIELAYDDGSSSAGTHHEPAPFAAPAPRIETRAPSQTWLRLQSSLRQASPSELSSLADLRGIPAIAGLELAQRAGQLYFAQVYDDGFEWPSWIITDASRRNAQARRLDGKPWSGIGGKKAKTIAGCEASWPIGISEADKPEIALVEGGPDFLAAWHLIWFQEKIRTVSPVAMLGASNPIHPDALPMFAGKKVWIFPHSDDNQAGEKAAAMWSEQLVSVGAYPTPFSLRSRGMKDLNELVAEASLHAEEAM